MHYEQELNGKTSSPTKERPFYGSDEEEENGKKGQVALPEMDPDHRLLLKSAQPLLQSRNNGVLLPTLPSSHPRFDRVLCAPGLEEF